MPGDWRTIRIFISSTFRDMHAERDHLVKFIFPELRERCARLRLHLVDVDLRWGVTEDEAERGRVLELCLDEIDRCRPYFIGLLGERYGWPPPRYDVPDEPRYDWVRELESGRSITALEIDHGVFRSPAQTDRAFFYFRGPGLLATLPSEARADFATEDERSAVLLSDLKTAIRRNCPNVRDYSCTFAGFAPDGRVALTGLEAFGALVLEDLWRAIAAAHSADVPARDPVAEERAPHEAFIEERTRRFIGRKDLADRIASFATGEGPGTVLVTGPPGFGKSALMAAGVRLLQRRNPDLAIVYHFVGAGPGSTDIRLILARLCRELAAIEGTADRIPEGPEDLKRTFRHILERLAEKRRIVLVIDALNQLDSAHAARSLDWLPSKPITGARLVLSTLAGDCLDAAMRLDPCPELIEVGPLSPADRRSIVRETLWEFRKRLDERAENDQMGALLAKAGASSPLYLLAACEELRVFGDFEGLGWRITAFPDDLAGLFGQVLERLERDHGRGLVEDSLSFLACSRNGLLESEMLVLVGDAAGALPKAVWSRLYRSLRFYLRPAGPSGQSTVAFFHGEFERAVAARYLHRGEERARRHGRLAAFFRGDGWDAEGSCWLAERPRPLGELAFHLSKAGQAGELFALASDASFLDAQARAFPEDPGLPLETIRRALSAAASTEDAVLMAEFTLAHAERVAARRRESPVWALQQGSLQRALSLAALEEPVRAALWKLAIAFELESSGRADESVQVLRDLGRTTLLTPPGWERVAARTLLLSLSSVPEDILPSPIDKLVGDATDLCVRRALIEGDIDKALALASGYDKDETRNDLLAEAFRWWRRQPPDQRTLLSLRRIAGQVRVRTLWEFDGEVPDIAAILIERHDLDAAEELVPLVGGEEERQRVLLSLARARAEAGEFDRAVEGALRIEPVPARVDALIGMARKWPSFASKALAAAGTAIDQEEGPARFEAAAALAVALEELGRRREARLLLERSAAAALEVTDHLFRSTGLLAVSEAAARLGAKDIADPLFAAIRRDADEKNPFPRIGDLSALALTMALSGSRSAAETLLVELARFASTLKDSEKEEGLKTIASAAGRTADDGLVSSVIAEVRPPEPEAPVAAETKEDKIRTLMAKREASRRESLFDEFRQIAVSGLAWSRVDRGDLAGAREKAGQLDPLRQLGLFTGIIEKDIGGGSTADAERDLSSFLSIAKAIKNDNKDYHLENLARIFLRAGRPADARDTARGISLTGLAAAERREAVAMEFALLGDPEGALEIVSGVGRRWLTDARLKVLEIIATSGRRERAGREVVEIMTENLPEEKAPEAEAGALTTIGQNLLRGGQSAAAGKVFRSALKKAESIPDAEAKNRIVHDIARSQLEAGDLTAASETGLHIADFDQRGDLFRSIAEILIEHRDLDAAAVAVGRIPSSYFREPALLGLVRAYVEQGRIREAREAAGNLTLLQEPLDLIEVIMDAEIETGDEAAARTSAERLIRESRFAPVWKAFFGSKFSQERFEWAKTAAARAWGPISRAEALGSLGAALVKRGAASAASFAFEAALKEASATGDSAAISDFMPQIKARKMASLAISLAVSGRDRDGASLMDRAIQLVDGIRAGRDRDRALDEIARLWSAAGKFQPALSIALAISDPETKAQAVRDLAVAQSKSGDLDGAIRVAGNFGSLEALERIAKELWEKGGTTGARRVVSALWRIADDSHSASYGEGALAVAASLSAEFGDARRAVEAIPRIREDRKRSSLAWSVLKACVERGDINSALKAHQAIETGPDSSAAARWIAEEMARQGDFRSAIAVAEGRKLGRIEPECVCAIAAILADNGQWDDARRLFKECSRRAVELNYEDLLADVAEAQARAGFGEDAADTARAILRERKMFLPKVAEAMGGKNDREGFKKILELCAYDLWAAFYACAPLVRLYPSAAGPIIDRLGSE